MLVVPLEPVGIPVQKNTLKRRLYQDLQHRKKERAQTREQYHYLTRWFNPNLQIDGVAAKAEIKNIYPLNKHLGAGAEKERRGIMFRRYKAYQAVERIQRADFYYSVDGTAGRFHSNLTNLKKDLRKHLTYAGRPLAMVDIANAQPLFSALLLKPEFYTGELELNMGLIVSLLPQITSTTYINHISSHLLIYITLQLLSERHLQNFQDYLASVQSGSFYQMAHQKMFPGEAYQKQKVKTAVFTTFFSDNRFIGQKEALPKKLFAQAFPEVYGVFKRIKRGNHTLLAHLLQRIESYVMVETVTRRIALERPFLPIFTIHDGLATLKGEEHYVQQVMEEEILRLTGLSCVITLEN